MEKDDYKFINEILRTTKSIEELYKELSLLEISGEKYSSTYNNLLEDLKMFIEIENDIYNNSSMDYERSGKISQFLFSYISYNNGMVEDNIDNKVIRRIIGILVRKISTDTSFLKSQLSNDLEISLGSELDDLVFSTINLQKAIESDFVKSYMYILNGFINDENYGNLKTNLIKSKYDTSFLNKDIEEEMLSTDFEVSEPLYFGSRLIADVSKIDLSTYESMKNKYAKEEAIKQISQLIEISDIEYIDEEVVSDSIVFESLIRACFLQMDYESIEELNCKFSDFLKNKDYMNRHQNDHISEGIIIKCFKYVDIDRTKPRVISLGR